VRRGGWVGERSSSAERGRAAGESFLEEVLLVVDIVPLEFIMLLTLELVPN
jgi:hypothetical protein